MQEQLLLPACALRLLRKSKPKGKRVKIILIKFKWSIKMKTEDYILLIAVLTYIGISFIDLTKGMNIIISEYGKLILFVGIIYILYRIAKKN